MNPADTGQNASDILSNDVVITGYGVRLPGANDIDGFWRVLSKGECVISEIGADRFSKEKYYNPDPNVRGKTYCVAAGQLENIWGFDAAYFGISPREAEQMDPQQRLLLEVTAESLVEAGLTRDNWDRSKTGVYIGASSSDYSTGFTGDPDAIDSQFMLGNTLSVMSNRLAYYFDIKGPSYTVDTACSSSFFAMDQAVEALRSGKIETAIVGAVNLLVSPIPFVGFSRAAMLSPDGLCKAFDKDANGYVRSEGAVVFVLRRMDVARKNRDHLRAVVHATAVNSDGRTVGLAMPSSQRQQELLQDIRAKFPFDLNDLAFVEAHGTGTAVGDPVEANAIGNAYGKPRGMALPIGSAKSNFGHLEPASGLVGLLKSVLALEKGIYPASLHIKQPNPHIDFADLNISLGTKPTLLTERNRPWLAGVNSFGFGGANAHVVVRQLWQHEQSRLPDVAPHNKNLCLSAASAPALRQLAEEYETLMLRGENIGLKINNAIYRREDQKHKIVALGDSPEKIRTALRGFLDNDLNANFIGGKTQARHGKVAFVFSGNGAAWPGMGRAYYQSNAMFKKTFDRVSDLFKTTCPNDNPVDLAQLLFAPEFEQELGKSALTQPLAFAIQVALSDCLVKAGLSPQAVLGHSAGEVPAAYAAGILSLSDAVHLVASRSAALGGLYGKGGMAAVLTGAKKLHATLDEFGAADIVMSAENSGRSTSISGPRDQLVEFAAFARKKRIAVKILDIAYPFHSPVVEQIKQRLLSDINGLMPISTICRYYSATRGTLMDVSDLNAQYWWENTRNPVLFRPAVCEMVSDGFDLVVEIGPKPILRNYLVDSVPEATGFGYVETMNQTQFAKKPVEKIIAKALVLGGQIDKASFHGPQIGYFAGLPLVPWQKKNFRAKASSSKVDIFGKNPVHPLLGHQLQLEYDIWQSRLDTGKIDWLKDHVIDGATIFPATGFIEIALAAGRAKFGPRQIEISDLEILRPVVFDGKNAVDFRTRFEPSASKVSIETRNPQGPAQWEPACFATLRINPVQSIAPVIAINGEKVDNLYTNLAAQNLAYGPEFTLAHSVCFCGQNAQVNLQYPKDADQYCLDPRLADAALHGLLPLVASLGHKKLTSGAMMVPQSFGIIRIFAGDTQICRANICLKKLNDTGLLADIQLCDAAGVVRAQMLDARFRTLVPARRNQPIPVWAQSRVALTEVLQAPTLDQILQKSGLESRCDKEDMTSDAALLCDSMTRAIIFDAISQLTKNKMLDSRQFGPLNSHGLLETCLEILGEDSLAKRNEAGIWTVAPHASYPEFTALLKAFLQAAPTHVQELQQILTLRENLLDTLTTGLQDKSKLPVINTLAGHRLAWRQMQNLTAAVLADWPAEKRLNILVLGRVDQRFYNFIQNQAVVGQMIISDFDTKSVAAQRLLVKPAAKLSVMSLPDLGAGQSFDLILSVDGLDKAGATDLDKLHGLLSNSGAIMALVAEQDVFSRVFDGLFLTNWDEKSLKAGLGVARKINVATLTARLRLAGFEQVSQTALPCPETPVCLVRANGGGFKAQGQDDIVWVLPAKTGAALAQDFSQLEIVENIADQSVIYPVVATSLMDPLLDLTEICKAGPKRILINCSGAAPLVAGLCAWVRVAVNEFPEIAIQVVENLQNQPLPLKEIAKLTHETHLVFEGGNLFAPRVFADVPIGQTKKPGDAKVLEFARQGQIHSLEWRHKSRVCPSENQVEIAVEYTGLNFRDVMWTQGLLPAEALEEGYVGASLGMECAGKVLRAGAASGFAVGDRVFAFSPAAFSSHVTLDARVVALIPANIETQAAAALPVAFLTALYAFDELARLSAGETVLIHGSAGGVGLAAIQVAKSLGARVFATAGTPEKRAFLRDLGAEMVFDSRSLEFAQQIQTEIGGVDVVLNSLAGEAMERSILCLKPFGRFVELGKRDFFANSRIGLRAFRKNLSYFGVDADQLLVARPKVVARELDRLKTGLASGEFTPPPCQIFEAEEAADAFSLMQKSGHIGKIILRAPKAEKFLKPAEFSARGAWLIIGGTGGLGLQTAKWLAGKGVEKLWLVSRSGASDLDGLEAPHELVKCDASDPTQMRQLFDKISADNVPLRGVIHAAMQLDDGLISTLNEARMAPVLAAKAGIGKILDTHCNKLDLDHFIIFSSIATLFGNPGQGAYVAGNGYLEGLAKHWQKHGKNATCIAFGPVSDQGYLADKPEEKKLINSQIGGEMLSMAQALTGLSEIIERRQKGVFAVGPMAWGNMAGDLKILRSGLFGQIDMSATRAKTMGKTDLNSLIKGLGRGDAIKKIVTLLQHEAAQVLRQPDEDINPDTALTEMGFDSLMALSLRMQAEENLGINLPLMALVDGMTLTGLACKVLDGDAAQQGSVTSLAAQHLEQSDFDPALVAKVANAAENIHSLTKKASA